jgi:hypothetical protein
VHFKNTNSIVKSRKVGWEHLEPMGDMRNAYVYAGKRNGRKHLEDRWRIILKWIIKNRILVVCASELSCS